MTVLLGRLLLISDRLPASLAGTSIVLGLLSTYGKTITVSDTAVRTDIHEALDVHLLRTAEVSLYLVIGSDVLTDSGSLIVCPVLDLGLARHLRLVEDGASCAAANAIDVGQCDLSLLVLR